MDASKQIDELIAKLTDWRGPLLTELRTLINSVEPKLTENMKWGTAVWSNKRNVCAVAAFKDHVKINFFAGASLADPDGLFNSGLNAKITRSIDLFEDQTINHRAFVALVQRAATA